MQLIWSLLLLSTCAVASPLPHSHTNYYQPNAFLEKDYYDYPLFEPSNKPISQGFYYSQVQGSQRHPEIAQAHPFIHPAQQHPYQYSQPFRPMTVLNYGQGADLANQVHGAGNRIQEIQPQSQDVYQSDVSTILSQFVNGFREQVQRQGIIGRPQQQPSYSAIQITPNGNGDEGLREITAIVYNSETGSVKEIPTLIYSTSSGAISPQIGSGPFISSYPQTTGQLSGTIQISNSPGSRSEFEPCNTKVPENIQSPVQQNAESAEDFIVSENASPEPTPGSITDSEQKPENLPSQDEINKKYPVTILTPDSTAASDSSNSNGSTDHDVPAQLSETESSSETSTNAPVDIVENISTPAPISEKASDIVADTTTTTSQELDDMTESVKAIEGETTISDVEMPAPK